MQHIARLDARRDDADEAAQRLALAQHPGDQVALDDAGHAPADQFQLAIDALLFQRLDDQDGPALGGDGGADGQQRSSGRVAVADAILSSFT